jgi:hypothetical protein
MEQKIIGAGMLFLGSGCGPVLSKEQQDYLRNVKPDSFEPLGTLLEILHETSKKKPELVTATGRRWGIVIKSETDKVGITDIKSAFHELCEIYQRHHQGDVGRIIIEEIGETEVTLTYQGPYPDELITGAYASLAMALGGDDVTVAPTGQDRKYRIAWLKGE